MKLNKSDSPAGLKFLRGTTITGKKVWLREKKLSDARKDYNWQSDPELCRCDAVPVLTLPFAVYLLDYAAEFKKTGRGRFLLAVETFQGKHIGNCTCYDIDEKKSEAQFGIMIGDPDYRGRGYGRDVVSTFIDYIFRTTALNRLYLKTLDWNLRAQKCFAGCGFIPCGRKQSNGYSFLLMEIYREQWDSMRRTETEGETD